MDTEKSRRTSSSRGETAEFRWQVETFGFHLASLEVRQHAAVHRAALDASEAAGGAPLPGGAASPSRGCRCCVSASGARRAQFSSEPNRAGKPGRYVGSDEEQSSVLGRFSGRGWADPVATTGQVRVRLWAVSRGRCPTCRAPRACRYYTVKYTYHPLTRHHRAS
jgi:hypothetical protein